MRPLKKLNESYNSSEKNNQTSDVNSTDIVSPFASMVSNEPTTTTIDQSNGAKQVSDRPRDATVRHRRINTHRIQNIFLIWLDTSIDDNSAEYRNTIGQLRQAMNDVNTFTDDEECLEFINSIIDTKICMIISGAARQNIVPRVHNMSQVDSIFILSDDKEHEEEWSKDWSKIRGVFTEISPICKAFKQEAQQYEQSAISISFVATSGDDVSKKNLDQLDPMFMYSQLLKEILLTIEFGNEHVQEYIDYCGTVFADNDVQLSKVDKLQWEYHTRAPIWWYTWESFLYPMLNRGLRVMDMDVIIKMGFFITDLHREIEQLHAEQFTVNNSNQIFTLYRGQGMSTTDFNRMTDTQGGLISFSNFLSTSKNRQVSLNFARRALSNMDMVGILFIMNIDPAQSATPFASTADVGCYRDKEAEILFSMHTVFRIGEITHMDENPRLFQISLTLTSDNDKDLRVLTDRIREETFPDARGWYRLCSFLLKVGESAKAQQVYEILLEQRTDMDDKANIFHQLGRTQRMQGKYQEAITFYEKALEIYERTLSPTDSKLIICYNNIGSVYYNISDYPKALSYHEKALEISEQSLPANHPDLGMSYNNIGVVYKNMGDYPKALSYYEKALEINKQSLPSNHPDLSSSYNNIGNVYDDIGDYPKAYSFYEQAVEIGKHSLPVDHPHLQLYIRNLDDTKKKL